MPPCPDVRVVGGGGWPAGRDQTPPPAFAYHLVAGVMCHRPCDEMLPEQLAGLRHRGGQLGLVTQPSCIGGYGHKIRLGAGHSRMSRVSLVCGIGHSGGGATRCRWISSSRRLAIRCRSPWRPPWSGSSARKVVVPGPTLISQSSNSARSKAPAWPAKVISYVRGCTGSRLAVDTP